jgi:uncharacterized protein YbgA (DUF1722 family)/uncharacterized protein YbbK (DUF523 family)
VSGPREETAAAIGLGAPDGIPVGISACLLGSTVRFDGGHKRDRNLTDLLGRHFRWVPACPEVEIGLGTPRESLRLVGTATAPRLVAPRSGRDLTELMAEHSARRVDGLAAQGLRGFVLKKDSPSCGLHRVRVYDGNGVPTRDGSGLFAQALRERLPNLPVEEEGRLNDPLLRESFVNRVFAYDRWLKLRQAGPRRGDLVAFHTAHKLLLRAHDPAGYRALGRLVAAVAEGPLEEVLDRYEAAFLAALGRPASSRRHVDVLQHLLGFLRPHLPGEQRQSIVAVIEEYRLGLLPRAAPVELLRHHLQRLGVAWVDAQVYLQPHPRDLATWAG